MRERELEHHARPLPGRAFDTHSTAMHGDQLAHHRETNAAAAGRGFGLARKPDVRLPNALPFVVRNTWPLVLDEHTCAFTRDLGADRDRLAEWSVFDGIVEQVEQNLPKRIPVEDHDGVCV